jgi:hypothetical protein
MESLALPHANQLYVVIGSQSATNRLLELAARLALRGPLLLIDCGNRASPLYLTRALRRLTADPVSVLANMQTARAFTCYQVVTLLSDAARRPIHQPVLVFDLLATFYDESVPNREARRLFEHSLHCIDRLHRFAPAVISAQPPLAAFPERAVFLTQLCRRSDQYWLEQAASTPVPQQPALFA